MTENLQKPKLVTVFGGSGFVGRYVVRALAKRGYQVRVACRRPDLAGFLQPLGGVSQIQLVQTNLRVRWSVDQAVQGASCVVNLVAILNQSRKQKFEALHDEGARAVAEAARAVGAHLVHVSALGVDQNSQSEYAATKLRGEAAVRENLLDAVILRPSVIFGQEDGFFNKFADMARFSPVLPLVGGGAMKFQPIYVGDVAEAVARAVDGKVAGGQTYELGGPQVLSMRQCLEEMLTIIGRKRMLVSLPWGLASLSAKFLGHLPGKLLTSDQVKLLKTDNVVSKDAEAAGRTLAAFGIQPQTLATILPTYLWRYRSAGQFTRPTEVEEAN